MGVSRQAFYQGRRRHAQRESRSQAVVKLVRDWRVRQPWLGTRKLHHVSCEPLARTGMELERDAMFDVLRNAGMLVQQRRACHKTTDNHQRFRRHPNLLKAKEPQLFAIGSEQV
jgi:putative transposase